MEWKKNILIGSLFVFVGALLGMMLTRSCKTLQIETINKVGDTVIIERVDTFTIIKPVPYKVEVRDTILLSDTIFIGGQMLFQEVKEYGDSTYYARISGINAHLEEWRTYPKTVTKYITNTERVVVEPKKWGLYGNAEYGFTSVDSRLCIGAELRYTAPKIEYFIKGGRELINNQSYVEIGTNVPIVRW